MVTSSKSAGTSDSSGSESKTGNIATLPGGFCASGSQSTDLTIKQYKMVLEVVAGRMATLQRTIGLAISEAGSDQAHHLDVADILAGYIGGMVDSAIGGDIIGDADYWNYGQSFATAGKEVHHG